MDAKEIHARVDWTNVLIALGIDRQFVELKPGKLRTRNGPCPICGGVDRYFFSNRHGRGDYFCRNCQPKHGDGFQLVMAYMGCDFATARRAVLDAAGLRHDFRSFSAPTMRGSTPIEVIRANPTRRVQDLLRTTCAVETLLDAREYLDSRKLLPLPAGHRLLGHAGADYFEDGIFVGRYPAIVAPVRDVDGDLVTVHVTYLDGGRKIDRRAPRKLLSPLTGRQGCAVRLMPIHGDTLGIAEGIETALSAAAIQGIPVWAAANATLLGLFEPPPEPTTLRIYSDRDGAGLSAALNLQKRLQGRINVVIHAPPPPAKDWNDVLVASKDMRSGWLGGSPNA